MSEDELKVIQKYYTQLSLATKKEESLQRSHSIDEAQQNREMKKESKKHLKSGLPDKEDENSWSYNSNNNSPS